MQNGKNHIYKFQVAFFAATTFIVHFLFFKFWSAENLESYFQNWFPVMMFDLIIGVGIGILNGLPWFLFGKNANKTDLIILVGINIFWLMFCVWWYFDNRGVINKEAVGHVISPFVFGLVGFILAVVNFVWFFIRYGKSEKITKNAG